MFFDYQQAALTCTKTPRWDLDWWDKTSVWSYHTTLKGKVFVIKSKTAFSVYSTRIKTILCEIYWKVVSKNKLNTWRGHHDTNSFMTSQRDEDEERNFFQGQVFEPRLIRDSNCLNSNNRIWNSCAPLEDHQSHSSVKVEASINSLSINANSVLFFRDSTGYTRDSSCSVKFIFLLYCVIKLGQHNVKAQDPNHVWKASFCLPSHLRNLIFITDTF